MIVAYFWTIKSSRMLNAIVAMGFDRFFLMADKNVSFHKSLGTGKGETFTPSDANALQWGLVAVVEDIEKFDSSAVVKRWRKGSVSEFRAVLEPISSHGQWAGKEPFVATAKDWDGQVAAITRARIKWSQNFRFWRAVPPVSTDLHQSPGLIAAIGIGEAPLGLQGTFSLWENGKVLRDFAYKGEAHQKVIKATADYNWYAEELFSRFEVRHVRGQL